MPVGVRPVQIITIDWDIMQKSKGYLFAMLILTSLAVGLDIAKLVRTVNELEDLKKSK